MKTTQGSGEMAFYMSRNEVRFSETHEDTYFLYRVYEFDEEINAGKYFVMEGSVTDLCERIPTEFRVRVISD